MELCSNCICLRGLKRNIHNMDNEENSETTLTTRTTTMTKSYITINGKFAFFLILLKFSKEFL